MQNSSSPTRRDPSDRACTGPCISRAGRLSTRTWPRCGHAAPPASAQYPSRQSGSPGSFCCTTDTVTRSGCAALVNRLNSVCGHSGSRNDAIVTVSVVPLTCHDGDDGGHGAGAVAAGGTTSTHPVPWSAPPSRPVKKAAGSGLGCASGRSAAASASGRSMGMGAGVRIVLSRRGA